MLRRRVALALLGLIMATALLLRGLLWLGDEWVEDAALLDLLDNEMAFRLQPAAEGEGALGSSLQYFRPAQAGTLPLPAALQSLPPGLYEEIEIDGEPWRVLVREVAPGDRAYLAYRIAFIEQREELLAAFATGGIVVLLLGAWWLSRRIAGRALAPLDSLVGQIRRLDLQQRGQRLDQPEDEDLAVIVRAINGHLAQLEALVERERAFAAGASHELRTPLALIQGSAEQIASGQAEPRVVERLRRGVRAATEQLEALLALSRTRESPPVEVLQLQEWLPAAAEGIVADHGAASRVHWSTTPAQLVGPPGAARIVFGNLLQNALRADPGGEVTVSVGPGCVAVEDRGPGLAAEVLEHAFEPGFRGREGGTGMGLYVARVLAERHGWHLELRNREGGGARAEWRFTPGPQGR